jgi:hypothetical protein
LAVTGRKQVEVEEAYLDDMGHRHTRRITTHRNVWTASVADAPSQGLSLKELPDKITEYIGHNTSMERQAGKTIPPSKNIKHPKLISGKIL